MTDFAWLIEAPGPNYLATRKLGTHHFHWTRDHNAALRFISEEQADGLMMTVREVLPMLFDFAILLGDARAVEHGWLPAPNKSSDLIKMLDDPKISAAVNDRGGGRGA